MRLDTYFRNRSRTNDWRILDLSSFACSLLPLLNAPLDQPARARRRTTTTTTTAEKTNETMTTAHRRNNNATNATNATHPSGHLRTNPSLHTKPIGSRVPSLPHAAHAGFDPDDRALGVALAGLRLSPGLDHSRTTSGGGSTGLTPSTASTSSSRYERTNNVPPRHRSGGGEKEYTQSPRERLRDPYSEVRCLWP